MSYLQQPILCLKDIPLFAGLSQNEFNTVCPGTINKSLLKGHYLFRQGDYDYTIYLVKSGKLKLIQNTIDGKEAIISIVGPGEVLGETNLFQERPHIFSAVAIESVRLCGFRREDLEKVIEMNPSFAVKIICHLSKKLQSVIEQVSESKVASTKERLLSVLIRLANEHGMTMSDRTLIQMSVTQQELGYMIGASRVKVAQILKELKKAGIVDHEGKYYTIKTDFCLQRV